MNEQPPIFTPNDEPYLGRQSLHAFDLMIVECLKINTFVAPYTRQVQKTDLQWAACQIIPAGISIALSVRELVRQGYLYGALVLERPLAERAITVLYLSEFPEAVEIWARGWSHKERPSLSAMISRIDAGKIPNCGPEITRALNSLVHGDPASAAYNLVNHSQNGMGHSVSRITNRQNLCNRACGASAAWMGILVGMMFKLFSQAFICSNQASN